MSTQIPATDKQITFVLDLIDERDTTRLVTPAFKLAVDRLRQFNPNDADDNDERYALLRNAGKYAVSNLISALLSCNHLPKITLTESNQLEQMLAQLPISKYALPRRDGTGWDFFELVERKTGRRFINRLLGAPGDWRREFMASRLMFAAARAIARDPLASAVAYAKEHGRCSVCDSPLSDPKSIAQSMGPVCAKRFS